MYELIKEKNGIFLFKLYGENKYIITRKVKVLGENGIYYSAPDFDNEENNLYFDVKSEALEKMIELI